MVGVLADIDLFVRLRARGQARGPEGLDDLQAALGIVTGDPQIEAERSSAVTQLRTEVAADKPSTRQRGRGWAWLADGVHIEQHMVCAVVDVAHTVTIAALHSGDLALPRSATETALLAAP